MQDEGYLENVLRERACGLCGADRARRSAPAEARCAVCKGELPRQDVLFGIGVGAARAACSLACLEVLVQEGLVGGSACPLCGTSWDRRRPTPRSCALCATPLGPEGGCVGLWRGGRVQAFCGPQCLEAYLRRANPFCG